TLTAAAPLVPAVSTKPAVAANPPPKPQPPKEPSAASPEPPVPPTPASHPHELIFERVAGATVKLEQLIGDQDKERHQPTRNQTLTKYGLEGAELGYSFEHQGRSYFLFGDVVSSAGNAFDTIAATDVADPEQGARLDFLTTGDGYLRIHPAAVSM